MFWSSCKGSYHVWSILGAPDFLEILIGNYFGAGSKEPNVGPSFFQSLGP